jgi:hypothetical protein
MRKLMTLHIDTSMVNWEEFAQNFRRLTEQFTPLPKANWWNWFGWWWRKPYGWLLTQKRHLRNILVGWRASYE